MKQLLGRTVYSVSEVNARARQALENLSFWVEGEIFSLKGIHNHYRYIYFDLKDPTSGYKLSCLVEPEIFLNLSLSPQEGEKVLVLGNLTLWEKDGRYQMFVFKIEQLGEGTLALELEELKNKLEAKGYFNVENKKTLPRFPQKIAVITSELSDAWQDFMKHSVEKVPLSVTFFDVLVQGNLAAGQIKGAIKEADKEGFDAIVIIRGGGQPEDLAAFNDELLADSIFAAKTPIIVGVGHEKDVTIAQLVADVAASTPTDAAKIISADFITLKEQLENHRNRMASVYSSTFTNNFQLLDIIFQRLERQKDKLLNIPGRLKFLRTALTISYNNQIVKKADDLSRLKTTLDSVWHSSEGKYTTNLAYFESKLSLLSPQNTLKRGYSITTTQNGKIIRSAESIDVASRLKVKFAKGSAETRVLSKNTDG
ncbi:exodeoxyribonuclease VII large subunit [Candidatus Curtissbacteria bacterium]|nr:exodeoxyribonuclease VII large subunit [Candidatus Curtissbacteria bacterium]